MAISPQYVIHGTSLDNLIHILATGKLETNPRNATRVLDPEYYNPRQIFTQILFKDLPHQEKQLSHWFMCGIILDKRILKDRQWYATAIGGFYERFADAFSKSKSHSQLQSGSEIIAKNATSHAARIPSLASLKKYITKQMQPGILGEVGFIHSHEILFGEDISLAEYGVCILVREWAFRNMISKAEQEVIKAKCQELGMQLVLYGGNSKSRYWSLGINKTIDLINEYAKG